MNNTINYISFLELTKLISLGGNFKRSITKKTNFDLVLGKLPEEYNFIKNNIQISEKELLEVFNCGIGMMFVVDKKYYSRFKKRNLFQFIGEIV